MHAYQRSSKPSFGYQNATYLVRRGGVWQYRRRVPTHLVERLATTEVRVSTKARDRTEAMRAAASISAALEEQWAKLSHPQPSAIAACVDYKAALATADALGVTYRPGSCPSRWCKSADHGLSSMLARAARQAAAMRRGRACGSSLRLASFSRLM
jgi:hypothetical protein